MTSREEKIELVERYFTVADSGNISDLFALIDEVFHSDYVCYFAGSKLEGPEALKKHAQSSLGALTEMKHAVEEHVVEGDTIVTRCTIEATHSGDFLGSPPTGKRLSFPAIYIQRVVDGKFTEAWLDYDSLFILWAQIRGGK